MPPLVDVSELFSGPESEDFMEDVTLRRPAIHFANEGEAIATYEADATIQASVQAMTAKEVAALPEGQRGSGNVYRVYTEEVLKFSPGKTDISDYLYVPSKDVNAVIVGEENWSGNGYRKFLATEFVPS
jgi:hypothetical protein